MAPRVVIEQWCLDVVEAVATAAARAPARRQTQQRTQNMAVNEHVVHAGERLAARSRSATTGGSGKQRSGVCLIVPGSANMRPSRHTRAHTASAYSSAKPHATPSHGSPLLGHTQPEPKRTPLGMPMHMPMITSTTVHPVVDSARITA